MFKKLKIQISKKSLIFLAVFIVLLAIDLVTKFIEEKYNLNFTVIPNFIWVESGVRNSGASFSMFSNAEWGQTFLKIVTILMIIVIFVAFMFIPERFTLTKIAIAAILAGAMGNLVDRFMLGSVRDFVWVNMIFTDACCNFADFWITFSVVIIAIDMLFLNEWAVFPLTKKAKLAQKGKQDRQPEHTEKTGVDTEQDKIITADSAEEKSEEKDVEADGKKDDG